MGLKGFFVGAEGGAELLGWVFGFGLVGFVGAAREAHRTRQTGSPLALTGDYVELVRVG